MTLEEAEQRSDFDLRELEEDPDRVYLGDRGTVWFLYGTPERIRLLVAQTPRLRVDEPAILKKLSGAGTAVEEVAVNGAGGVFLSGEPHFIFLFDEFGQVVDDSARLAANVLVWDEGGVAYRIEGELDRDEALEIARRAALTRPARAASLRPCPQPGFVSSSSTSTRSRDPSTCS